VDLGLCLIVFTHDWCFVCRLISCWPHPPLLDLSTHKRRQSTMTTSSVQTMSRSTMFSQPQKLHKPEHGAQLSTAWSQPTSDSLPKTQLPWAWACHRLDGQYLYLPGSSAEPGLHSHAVQHSGPVVQPEGQVWIPRAEKQAVRKPCSNYPTSFWRILWKSSPSLKILCLTCSQLLHSGLYQTS